MIFRSTNRNSDIQMNKLNRDHCTFYVQIQITINKDTIQSSSLKVICEIYMKTEHAPAPSLSPNGFCTPSNISTVKWPIELSRVESGA